MTTLVINGNEYNIKYGYLATARCGVVDKVEELQDMMKDDNELGMEDVNKILNILPEILLAGLQKCHSDEFGYDYDTGDGKKEALDKAYILLDDYFDENDEKDIIDMFTILTDEMVKNGFLANALRKGAETQGQKPKAPAKKTTRTTKKATA